MKIRHGFVSNSSSSSFVIPKEEYSSVFDLAKKMIPHREWDFADKELINKIDESEIRGMDKNTSICFNSCNYETYIVLYKDYYLISTCNNHNWYLKGTPEYFPEELKELIKTEYNKDYSDCYYEELESVVSKLSPFWYPEYNVGGTPLEYGDPDRKKFSCNEHYEDIIRIKGHQDPICVACYGEKLKKENSKKNQIRFASLSLRERVSFVEDKFLSIGGSLTKRDKQRIFKTLEEVKRII